MIAAEIMRRIGRISCNGTKELSISESGTLMPWNIAKLNRSVLGRNSDIDNPGMDTVRTIVQIHAWRAFPIS
jgi:hypothetical protein